MGGERKGFAFLGLYRKHAHVHAPKLVRWWPHGGKRAGSKVVCGFHVRRVQRLSSLHARARDSRKYGSTVFHVATLCRQCAAAMPVISSSFSILPLSPSPSPVPSRITLEVCEMFVGCARGGRNRISFRVFSSAKDGAKLGNPPSPPPFK